MQGAALTHIDGLGIRLEVAAVYTIIYYGTFRIVGTQQRISVAVVAKTNGLADRHSDTPSLGKDGIGTGFQNRHNHEAERRLHEFTLVFIQHIRSATCITKGTIPSIERDDGSFGERHLVGMTLTIAAARIYLFCPPMSYGSCHSAWSSIEQAFSCIRRDCQPTHIFLVSSLLRTDVVRPLLCNGAMIDAQMSGIIAVSITVERSSAEPRDVLCRIRHLETEAQLRQDSTFDVWRRYGADANRAVGIDAELLVDGKD